MLLIFISFSPNIDRLFWRFKTWQKEGKIFKYVFRDVAMMLLEQSHSEFQLFSFYKLGHILNYIPWTLYVWWIKKYLIQMNCSAQKGEYGCRATKLEIPWNIVWKHNIQMQIYWVLDEIFLFYTSMLLMIFLMST